MMVAYDPGYADLLQSGNVFNDFVAVLCVTLDLFVFFIRKSSLFMKYRFRCSDFTNIMEQTSQIDRIRLRFRKTKFLCDFSTVIGNVPGMKSSIRIACIDALGQRENGAHKQFL